MDSTAVQDMNERSAGTEWKMHVERLGEHPHPRREAGDHTVGASRETRVHSSVLGGDHGQWYDVRELIPPLGLPERFGSARKDGKNGLGMAVTTLAESRRGSP